MGSYLILIFSGVGLLILIIVVVLRKHYRKVIKEKEHGIVIHIHEQDRLAKELECINVEKKVMEKMLRSKFNSVVLLSTETQGTQSCTEKTQRPQKNNLRKFHIEHKRNT